MGQANEESAASVGQAMTRLSLAAVPAVDIAFSSIDPVSVDEENVARIG